MNAYKWGDRMKHIGVIPNKLKDTDLKITAHIAKWFNERQLSVYASLEVAEQLEAHTIAVKAA